MHEYRARRFVGSKFDATAPIAGDLLGAVIMALVGTKQVRQGATPDTCEIRRVVSACMQKDVPIPIVVPWGCKKVDNSTGVDLAEIAALKQMEALQRRVQQLHAPGICVRIRCEDIGAFYLFDDQGEEGACAIRDYALTFPHLPHLLGLDDFITVFMDSDHFPLAWYTRECERVAEVFYSYLLATEGMEEPETHPTYRALEGIGWKGSIPPEMREHFYASYARLYDDDRATSIYRLARYFAQTPVRKRMNAAGNLPEWGNDWLQLNFAPPVPGVPMMVTNRILYYRTFPTCITRTHILPWRAKGYLKECGEPALTSFRDPMFFVYGCIELRDERASVRVRCDVHLPEIALAA